MNATELRIFNTVQPNAPFVLNKDAPANSIYVGSDGNVGIGTGSGGAKLYVVGNGAGFHMSGGTFAGGGAIVVNATGSTTGYDWLWGHYATLNVPGNAAGSGIVNSSNASAGASARYYIQSTHPSANAYLEIQGGGTLATYNIGVNNASTNNVFEITHEQHDMGGNYMYRADPINGWHSFYKFGTQTHNEIFPGLTATPEATITANPGDKAYTNISATGKTFTKVTGSANNTGWAQDLNTTHYRVLFDWTDDQSNVGAATETDIFALSVAASELPANGTKIVLRSFGTLNTVAGTNTLKVYFGGQVVFNSGSLTVATAGSFSAETTIMRTAATTAKAITVFTSTGSGLNTTVVETDLTGVSYAGANITKLTGTGSASNTMTGKFATITKVGPYSAF
ncbi:MAG: hypothetical protein ABIN95_04750 [Mucilaginibacter sp.]